MRATNFLSFLKPCAAGGEADQMEQGDLFIMKKEQSIQPDKAPPMGISLKQQARMIQDKVFFHFTKLLFYPKKAHDRRQ